MVQIQSSRRNLGLLFIHKDTTQNGQTKKLKNQGGLHHFKIDKL